MFRRRENLRQGITLKPKKKRGRFKRFILVVFGLLFSIGFLAASVGVLYLSLLSTKLPSPSQLNTKKISQSTKIFDRSGETLLFEVHGDEKRTVIPFEEIPEHLKEATLAAEDANFYSEPAFDWRAILRAFIVNLREGRVVQGGSTISQQLAKNVFLTSERTITRKIKELILAVELESRYSKDEILWLYLNQIPYGSNVYGVEAASQAFFNKSARDLDLAEAAVLASLPKAPSRYSPWGNRVGELLDRKDYVLNRMKELAFAGSEEVEEAREKEVKFDRNPATIGAYHLSLAVRGYLVDRYGEDVVTAGGLRVITTLDWDLQEIAERVVLEGAERNTELYEGRNVALVAQDPKTGQVLAMVGSKDPFGDPEPLGCTPGFDCRFEPSFNVATQGLRQPGSALKPFAYLTAFEKGYLPETIVYDVPTEFASYNPKCPFKVDFSNEEKECFHPRNYDDFFRGPVSLAEGLSQSINVPSVKALYLAGFDDVLENIYNFGVNTLRERGRYGLSLVLGGGEVRLAELVNAYATLSQEGIFHEQTFILEVKDSEGEVLESYRDKTRRAMDGRYPRIVNQILSDKELRAGLFQGSLPLTVFAGRDVALKTGTTNDYRDAWSIGYTPSLVVGVWAGNNDNTPMEQKGGSILAAVPTWSAFLGEALDRYPEETFARSDPRPIVSKPMLNGQSIYVPVVEDDTYPQIHSILHYVDRDDVSGEFPEDVYEDFQYPNWEESILEWAKTNISNFVDYNKPIPEGAVPGDVLMFQGDVTVTSVSPANGSFVKTPFLVKADIVSKEDLEKVQIYFNGRLLNEVAVGGKSYSYYYYIFGSLQSQNLIEIRAQDVNGGEGKRTVIVYN